MRRPPSRVSSRSMRLSILALILVACEPSAPPASPTPPTPEPLRVEETVRARDSTLTLSVRRVEAEGWSGRVVVASFSLGAGRHVTVVPSEGPRPLDAILAERSPPRPFAAIDGGFYDSHGAPMGLVRTGGEDRAPLTERGGSGVFFVDGDRARVVHRDDFHPSPSIREALQSVDRIVDAGASVVSAAASNRRAARSAVAIDEDGAVHLAVAFDERAVLSEGAARIELGPDSTRTGPTLGEWATLLTRPASEGGVSAREALGLDGGYSTSLVVKSDTRALSVVAYRATINGLLVTARPAPDE